MPEIGPRHDKELIFFAILFVLNILCDIIHEVVDKHVYVSLTDLIDRAVGQFQKRLASVILHTEQHFD